MRLARRIALVQWGALLALAALVAAGVVVVWTVGAPYLFFPVVLIGLFLARHTMRRAGSRVAMWELGRLPKRLADGKLEEAKRSIKDLREAYRWSRPGLELLHWYDAELLGLEERHAEAAALLESLDIQLIAPAWEPLRLNNLAWSLALSGRADRAVPVARASLELAEKADGSLGAPDLRACQLGTLGTALVLAAQPEEGVPLLEQAIARGGIPWHQAVREFHRGQGLEALGRHEEAREAWAGAVKAAPDTAWGERARVKLGAKVPYRS